MNQNINPANSIITGPKSIQGKTYKINKITKKEDLKSRQLELYFHYIRINKAKKKCIVWSFVLNKNYNITIVQISGQFYQILIYYIKYQISNLINQLSILIKLNHFIQTINFFKNQNSYLILNIKISEGQQFENLIMAKMFILKSVAFLVLLTLLGLGAKVLWQLHEYEIQNQIEMEKYSMFINKYKINRNTLWNSHFQKKPNSNHKKLSFDQKGQKLLIQNKYIAFIGHQGEHYQQKTIQNVITQTPNTSKSQISHFIVRSQVNQQIFYLPSQPQNKQIIYVDNKQYSKLQKCLQLQKVQLNDKVHYFVDDNSNFWLVSHPHNNIVFIQIYNCKENKLVKKIFHEPKYHTRSYLINELIHIKSLQNNNYQVKLLTYESHQYIIALYYNAQQDQYQVSSSLNPSYIIQSQKVLIQKDQAQINSKTPSISYQIFDPLNKIFQRQFQYLAYSILKNFMDKIKYLLNAVGVSPKILNSFINSKLKEYQAQKAPQNLDHDIQVYDQQNQCVINIEYDINDEKLANNNSDLIQQGSSITKLDKHLLPTRSPVFHPIDNYDPYDIVQILKDQKTLPITSFKTIFHQKGYERQYSIDKFYSIFKTSPDNHIHYLGIGQKIFYLHPSQKVNNQEYLHIRSKTGGLVMQGNKIKGVYEDRPVQKIQITQKYFIQSNQVLQGVHQAHAGYRSLYVSIKGTKLQLVNGLSGKTMVSYHINFKQGYQYAGTYLFNNQWWVVQFNTQTRRSELIKHQLYMEASYPKQINVVKRTYGKFIGSEFSAQEDDVQKVFLEFINKYGNNGFIVLDIYRCIDQFYYIQFCDVQGKHYSIARIHFKRLSNRQPKSSRNYAHKLQQSLIVEPKNMVKQKQKMDPYLIVLQNFNLFEGAEKLIQQKRVNQIKSYINKNKNTIISELKRTYKFDLLPFTVYSRQNVNSQSQGKKGSQQLTQQQQQQIFLINMRNLVENGKKKLMIQTKQLAKNRLKYFVIFIVVIVLALMIKLLLSGTVKSIQADKSQEGEKRDHSQSKVQKKKGQSQKSQNKQKSN